VARPARRARALVATLVRGHRPSGGGGLPGRDRTRASPRRWRPPPAPGPRRRADAGRIRPRHRAGCAGDARLRVRARPRGPADRPRLGRRSRSGLAVRARPTGGGGAQHGRLLLRDLGALRRPARGGDAAGRSGRRDGRRAHPHALAGPRGRGDRLRDLRRAWRLGRARHDRAGRAGPPALRRHERRGPARGFDRGRAGGRADRRGAAVGSGRRRHGRAAPGDAGAARGRWPGGRRSGAARGCAGRRLAGRALLGTGIRSRPGGGGLDRGPARPPDREGGGLRGQPRVWLPRWAGLSGGIPRGRTGDPRRQSP
jgi:hypothetical protein